MADLDRIRAKCTEDEAEDLALLERAVEQTRAAYQDGWEVAAQKKWDAARENLKAFKTALEVKYFPTEKCFETRLDAVQWLIEAGYKIKKSKFYGDCKKGLCVVEHDGRVRCSEVEGYAAKYLDRLQDEDGNTTALTEEKTKLEIEKLKTQNEKALFEMEKERGKWVLKKDLALEFSVRAGVMDSGVRHLFMTRMVDWISMAGGNTKKVQTVLEVALADWDILVNEYASMDTMHVLFEEEN